jgi:hypothetical protein
MTGPDSTSTSTSTSTSITMTARADVVTDNPARYAKQLVAHLGRKVEFTIDGPRSTGSIGGGTGTVVVGDGILMLAAAGPDEEVLALVEHVLGSHLERFGARNELIVDWQRTVEPTPEPEPRASAA